MSDPRGDIAKTYAAHIRGWFTPNHPLAPGMQYAVVATWASLALAAWSASTGGILPKPVEVLNAFPVLWNQRGLGQELWISLSLNLQAISILMLLCFSLAYLSRLAFFKPVVLAFSLGRFNGFIGLPLIFTLWLGNPHLVKVALLVFGAGVFTVPSLLDAIAAIPSAEYDHARTLRFPEWRVVWEVIVLGQFDVFMKVLRTNGAMVWMLTPFVEILFRYEGGIGSLMEDLNKRMDLPGVYAATFAIFLVGFSQDALIGLVTKTICPYSELGLEHS